MSKKRVEAKRGPVVANGDMPFEGASPLPTTWIPVLLLGLVAHGLVLLTDHLIWLSLIHI